MKKIELKKLFLLNVAKKDYKTEEECYRGFLKVKRENDCVNIRYCEDEKNYQIFDPFRLFVRSDIYLNADGWSN